MTEYKVTGTDVAVIGAGHAGIEAALACARLGVKTVMFTLTKCQNHIDVLLLLSLCRVVSDTLRHVIGALHVHFSCDTLNHA